MKHPAPVMALLHRSQKKLRRSREDLRDAEVCIDNLEVAVAVMDRRAQQWRRTAMELAAKVGPKALSGALMQAQHDELQDLKDLRNLPEAGGVR